MSRRVAMPRRTIIVSNVDPAITATPLETERDYEAALERLEEMEEEEGNEESYEEERMEEFELLQALVEEFEEREGIMEEADDYVLLRRLPDPETVELAVFNLSNGNEVRLLGTPDNGELAVVEISDCGVEDFLLDERWAPNAIFRKFAPKDYPVPQMFMRLDSIGAFEGRKVVDAVAEPIEVELAALGALAFQSGGDLSSCSPGPVSAASFQAQHCNTSGGPGYGKSESYCYPNAALEIQKTSKKSRRTTYTRMAAGGTGLCRVRHYYKKIAGWQLQLTWSIQPQRVCSHWSALQKVGSLRKRRVRFEAIEPGGFVRGWVRYHRQCAGGWF
jgi:hypothetical protein